MNIELYKFIKPPEHPDPQHLIQVSMYVNIPTEVVVRNTQIVTPYQARAYQTHLFFINDKIVDYEQLRLSKEFKGSAHYDEIALVEVWIDYGDDGHTGYNLNGWMYVPFSRLEEELNGHAWFRNGGLPICMSWGDNYPEQYEHLKDMIYKYENNLPPYNKEEK
jgi:hypothetical protein